jgi:hypothetical protein
MSHRRPPFPRIWLLAAAALTLLAEGQETFKARISPVPIDAQLAPVITGVGSVTAVLVGTNLNINGTFEGMHSPATVAHLNQSKMTGVPGVTVGDLMVTKDTHGTVSGSVNLTPAQVEALRKGLLYIQVHSEGAPDGNLWGWLLK